MKLRVKPALAGACVVTVLLVTLMDESDDDSVFKLVSALPLRHIPHPRPPPKHISCALRSLTCSTAYISSARTARLTVYDEVELQSA